jgi:hypothetical protein
MQRFEAAPWPVSLKVVSALATVALLGAAGALFWAPPPGTAAPNAAAFGRLVFLLPAVILLVALLFLVRGYQLDTTGLYVERLLWRTSVGLGGLSRAWHDPSAMRRSLRLFGNGGLFSITGIFRNGTLGRYRAFVTDPKRAVVLRYESRVVVVSPADPDGLLGFLKVVAPATVVGNPPSAG